MNFRLTTLQTPDGEKIICRAEELDEQLTQEDWFNMLESLCAEEFDAIEFKTTRDFMQDRRERHGEPYRATKAQAQAYIEEWKSYKEDLILGRDKTYSPSSAPADKEWTPEQLKALEEFMEKNKPSAPVECTYKPPTVERDTTKVVGWRTVIGADGKVKVNEPIYSIKKWND